MLLDGHRRAVNDRHARQQQRNALRRRAAQHLRAKAEIRHADDREHAALDDGDRMQQRRHRGRRDGGLRQPHVERENRRLHAEAEERAQVAQLHHRRVLGRRLRHHAAHRKRAAVAVVQHQHHADKRQRRAEEGIEHVGVARVLGGLLCAVHDQRQRAERQKFIEEIQRQDVGRRGNAQRHAVGDGVEREEMVLAALVLHVLKAVERGQRPEEGDNRRKHAAHAVNRKANGQILQQEERRIRHPPPVQQTEQHQQRGDHRHRLHQHLTRAVADPPAQQEQQQTAHNRKKNRKA